LALEKSLVDILHEYKDSGYKGDNGWNSEGWNKMVKEFHLRNKYVNYTKSQIQDKEGQLLGELYDGRFTFYSCKHCQSIYSFCFSL